MKVDIKRERWIVVRDKTEIFCGLARDYKFKKFDKISDTPIKTYLSEAKARAGFLLSWWDGQRLIDEGRIEFVKVVETISNDLKEQVRKETTKEILLDLRKDISQCYGEYALEIVDGYLESYGVEVDE